MHRVLKPDSLCVSFYGWVQAEKFTPALVIAFGSSGKWGGGGAARNPAVAARDLLLKSNPGT